MTEPLQLDTVAGLPQWAAVDPDTGVPMDGRGRYLVPNVGERERASWQRCTNLAGSLAERYALEIHAQNALLLGLGARPDLRDLATTVSPNDKVALRKLRSEALAAGGRDVKANHGVGFHELSRPLDWAYARGGPEALRAEAFAVAALLDSEQQNRLVPMLEAYANALMHYDIRMPDGIENVRTGDPTELVFHDPRIKVVGRLDKVRKIAGRNAIVDLKTGDDPMRHGAVEIAMQLAIPAHAPHYWYENAGEHGPALPVDRETAYVLHVPHGGDFAELIAVDIAQAWRWVYLALQVRALHSAPLESFAMPLGRVSAREAIHVPGAGSQPGRVWPWQGSQAAAAAVGLPPVADPPQADATPPPAPDGSEVRVLVQGGAPAAVPAPAAAPPATTETPAAGGEEQGSAEPTKRQRACSRCRRPGHQARSCTYVTAVAKDGSGQLTPIIDERTTTLIANGKASDPENVAPGGGVAVTAELERATEDRPGPDGIGNFPLPAEPDAPAWCTCMSGWEHGWSNRGDGVWVHAAPHCGKPNYAAGARANASQVLRSPTDPQVAAMAHEALEFFTAHPEFQPPQKAIDAGWPPPFTPSSPAPSAGSTTTPESPVPSAHGSTDSQAISTAPPATTATPSTPNSLAPSPSATPTSSPQPFTPQAAPVADFSQMPVVASDWPRYLAVSNTLGILTERVQQAISAGAWDEPATRAAMARRGELQ